MSRTRIFFTHWMAKAEEQETAAATITQVLTDCKRILGLGNPGTLLAHNGQIRALSLPPLDMPLARAELSEFLRTLHAESQARGVVPRCRRWSRAPPQVVSQEVGEVGEVAAGLRWAVGMCRRHSANATSERVRGGGAGHRPRRRAVSFASVSMAGMPVSAGGAKWGSSQVFSWAVGLSPSSGSASATAAWRTVSTAVPTCDFIALDPEDLDDLLDGARRDERQTGRVQLADRVGRLPSRPDPPTAGTDVSGAW